MASEERSGSEERRVEDSGGDGAGGTIAAGAVGGETMEGDGRGHGSAPGGTSRGIGLSEVADGMPGGSAVGGGPGLTTDGRS